MSKKATPSVIFKGVKYKLSLQPAGYRLRRRSCDGANANFRTGTHHLETAKVRALAWLEKNAGTYAPASTITTSNATLETLAQLYLAEPKRTKANVAADNVSRLRQICRLVHGKELSELLPSIIGADFWRAYQMKRYEQAKLKFDLVTRHIINTSINAATRAARCLFLPALCAKYRAAGIVVRADATLADTLPQPNMQKEKFDDEKLIAGWRELFETDRRLWLVIGLGRFAGMRRDEIAACRLKWIEKTAKGAVAVRICDRPTDLFWTKRVGTGANYLAHVIDPDLAEVLWLAAENGDPEELLVADPSDGSSRSRWFERVPQKWLKDGYGIPDKKPLHRLRGLYADQLVREHSAAFEARQAGLREAQQNLGHKSSMVTQKHYVSKE